MRGTLTILKDVLTVRYARLKSRSELPAMKLAVSNIGWPFEWTDRALEVLSDLGVDAIEIAPSKVWQDTWNISFDHAEKFRKKVESYDLGIVGLHSIFYDQPELSLFKDRETWDRTIKFLQGLGRLCSDLGGKTIVFGGQTARTRGELSVREAMSKAVEFFSEAAEHMEREGVILCVEPLWPEVADFANSAVQALELIHLVDRPGFRGQLDTASLHTTGEIEPAIFEAYRDVLVHVHASEPELVEIGSTGRVNHREIRERLKMIKYDKYISIEQRTIDERSPLDSVVNSVTKVRAFYFSANTKAVSA